VTRARHAAALAPAKVNLVLDVLGRRADGYHEIDTRMVALALADVLHVHTSSEPGVRLALRGPAASADVPTDRGNVAVRAAELVLAAARVDTGLELELCKHVPSRAGLGGASADAAAAVVACQAVLGCRWPRERTLALLAELGSDTVFFAAASSTGHGRARGRGELVEVLPALPREWLVLVVPDVGCPTPAVYAAHAQSAAPARANHDRPNALEPAALAAVPALALWRAALDARFHLSGSGSAFFARCGERAEAEAVLAGVRGVLARRGLEPVLATVASTADAAVRLLYVGGGAR